MESNGLKTNYINDCCEEWKTCLWTSHTYTMWAAGRYFGFFATSSCSSCIAVGHVSVATMLWTKHRSNSNSKSQLMQLCLSFDTRFMENASRIRLIEHSLWCSLLWMHNKCIDLYTLNTFFFFLVVVVRNSYHCHRFGVGLSLLLFCMHSHCRHVDDALFNVTSAGHVHARPVRVCANWG